MWSSRAFRSSGLFVCLWSYVGVEQSDRSSACHRTFRIPAEAFSLYDLPLMADESPRKRVIVIGAGFAGLNCVKGLNSSKLDVILIDRHNYHLFQPLLYQVATA